MRDLSGIYIFSKVDGKKKPICLEEATRADQARWLMSLEKDALINTCFMLIDTINEIAEAGDITREPLP